MFCILYRMYLTVSSMVLEKQITVYIDEEIKQIAHFAIILIAYSSCGS